MAALITTRNAEREHCDRQRKDHKDRSNDCADDAEEEAAASSVPRLATLNP
jgi:hypothetical protein